MPLLPPLPKLPIKSDLPEDNEVRGNFLRAPRQVIKDFFTKKPIVKDVIDLVTPGSTFKKTKSGLDIIQKVTEKVIPKGNIEKPATYTGTPIANKLIEKVPYFKPTPKVRARDIVREVPDAIAEVGSGILQSIARNLSLVGKKVFTADPNATVKPKNRLEEMLYGVEVGEEHDFEKEGRDIADIVGQGEKIPTPAAIFLGSLSAGLDTFGFGGEKSAIKTAATNIAKETAPDVIKATVKNLFPKLSDTVIEKIMPDLVKETTEDGILNIFKRASLADEAGKVIRGEEVVEDILPTQSTGPTAPLEEVVQSGKSLPGTIPQDDEVVQKVIQALQEAKPIRGNQETIYSKERSRRLGAAMGVEAKGEEGFYKQLGQLKGEIPKVQFESLKGKVSQEAVDRLFDLTRASDELTGFEKIRAQEGLAKLFGEYGGQVPTKSEIALLERVFPKQLIDELIDKRPLLNKFAEAGLQLVNIPRSLMSSLDLSFGLRQGIFAAPRYRKAFWKSWKSQFKVFGSEDAYKATQEALRSNPNFELAQEAGLSFTDVGKGISDREEAFASQWAEKIPVIGKGVRASGRAYTAFANKYRLDIFSDMIKDAEKLGLDPKNNMDQLQSIANFVNAATGRGSLGKFEDAAPVLNALFFSPRLIASRLQLLNPVYYATADPFVRKEALKTLFTYATTMVGVLTAASQIPGVEVGVDPRSADFGKIKIGNTRIDITGGFQQYIRMAAQIITGKYISTTTGKEYTLGEGYKPTTRLDILYRQIESKEAPLPSLITQWLRQQDYTGQPVNMKKEIINRVTPILVQDIIQLAKEDPALLPLEALAFFGVGVQTYEPKPQVKGSTGRPGMLPPLPKAPTAGVGKLPPLPRLPSL